jgi:tritrans,polycis-undecaprenyl-diphosphate synthase [geranylgeranyl-diphosphate specific]
MKPSSNKVPRHLAVILDGNRRFAKRLMLKPWKGHEWGQAKVEKLLKWCDELGIKELTLYAFSIQNFNRPKEEFDYLMDVFRKACKKMLTDSRIEKARVRINFIGRLYMLPKDLQELIRKVMEKTKNYQNRIVNIAMAYGGREEVIDAARRIAEKLKRGELNIEDINEETFSRNLYLDSDPDLVIRTGGEHRTSNFLIWQSNYSELVFVDKMWPEFEKEDLMKCIEDYASRERRFGR